MDLNRSLKIWWYPGRRCHQGTCLVLRFYCDQGLCWCPWLISPPKTMPMSIVCAATWSHFDAQGHAAARGHDVGGLHCHLRPHWWLWSRQTLRVLSGPMGLLQLGPHSWSVLSPETVWRFMVHAPLTLESMGATFAVISTAEAQLRRRDMWGFWDHPDPHPKPPSQKNRQQPRQEAIQENSWNLWWRAQLFTTDGSWQVQGEDSVLIKGQSTEFDHAVVSI